MRWILRSTVRGRRFQIHRMNDESSIKGQIIRQGGEVAAIIMVAAILQWQWASGWMSPRVFCLVVLAVAF